MQQRTVGRFERGWGWVRRHPARAASIAALGVVLVSLGAGVGVALFFQGRLAAARNELSDVKRSLSQALEREKSLSREVETLLHQPAVAEQEARQAGGDEGNAGDAREQMVYLRTVTLALAEWSGNARARAEQLLEECPPAQRGWEWHYLYRLCHPESMTLKGHTERVFSVAYSPDGRRIASGSWDGTIRTWDAATGRELRAFPQSALREPDQGADPDQGASGLFPPLSHEHASPVFCVVFSPDGQRLAGACWDGTLKVWDAGARQDGTLTLEGHWNSVFGVAFSPDGQRLATASADGTAIVWDTAGGHKLLTLRLGDRFENVGFQSVAFSPDGQRLAGAGDSNIVKIWDAATGQEIRVLQWHTDVVWNVAFSPDGQRLATADGHARVKVWDAATGRELLTLQGHTDGVYSVAFSPDGQRLASAGRDGTAIVWDAATGHKLLTLPVHGDGVNRVAFSPDGRRIVGISGHGTVKVWDAATGEDLLTLRERTGAAWGVAFSPDGRRIAIAGGPENTDQGRVTLWDAASGEETLVLAAHSGPLYRVAFSPDGKRLAAAGSGPVKLWDARSGRWPDDL